MVPSLVNPTCDTAELIPTTEARTDTGGDGARLNGGDGGGVADGGVADGGGAEPVPIWESCAPAGMAGLRAPLPGPVMAAGMVPSA